MLSNFLLTVIPNFEGLKPSKVAACILTTIGVNCALVCVCHILEKYHMVLLYITASASSMQYICIQILSPNLQQHLMLSQLLHFNQLKMIGFPKIRSLKCAYVP